MMNNDYFSIGPKVLLYVNGVWEVAILLPSWQEIQEEGLLRTI